MPFEPSLKTESKSFHAIKVGENAKSFSPRFGLYKNYPKGVKGEHTKQRERMWVWKGELSEGIVVNTPTKFIKNKY